MYTYFPTSLSHRAIRKPASIPYSHLDGELAALLQSLGIGYTPDDYGPIHARCEAGSRGQRTESGAHEAVELAKGFVETHAGEAIDLDRVAEEVGISKFHLVRLFREAEGTTPWAYVRAARIRKAKELLDQDLPLVDVALLAGFYDQSHFNRVFREAEGKTPGQYREERKNIQD